MHKWNFVEKQWGKFVTPKSLISKPIHRWYTFPHSFTSELVEALVDEWGLGISDRILDPFCGAGTTVLTARNLGISSTGFDISPFAVFISKVKCSVYKFEEVDYVKTKLFKQISSGLKFSFIEPEEELLKKAFVPRVFSQIKGVWDIITYLDCNENIKNFFRLGVLKSIHKVSRARISGGWYKWEDPIETDFISVFENNVDIMLEDLNYGLQASSGVETRIETADARCLPSSDDEYSAVITSPPYPNRHDYSRIFNIELLIGFLNSIETKKLRYQSFHSHPEAKPVRPVCNLYSPPHELVEAIERIKFVNKKGDPRVPRMIEGYFLDLFCFLSELKRICKSKARIAIVIGNAQYSGIPILCDELCAEIATSIGLICDNISISRYRGNSAQQMAKFGRNPSRESVVVLRNPG